MAHEIDLLTGKLDHEANAEFSRLIDPFPTQAKVLKIFSKKSISRDSC